MESHSFPEMCILCRQAVNLRIDLCADENGRSIHEDCYVRWITNGFGNPVAIAIGD
jgi:hypothetical protein